MIAYLGRWKTYRGNIASAVLQRPDSTLRWYGTRRYKEEKRRLGIEEAVLQLGDWLKNRDYEGVDLDVWNAPRRLSTTCAFSLTGWMNLYKRFGDQSYLKEIEHCLGRLLSMQDSDGAWLFPYPFGGNPSNFPYACENFMTLKALFRYCEEVGAEEVVVRRVNRALEFLLDNIGYSDGVFWYSPSHRHREEIPNISSMAATIFARAHVMFHDSEFLRKAHEFANYCVSKQTDDGAFVYLAGSDEVYIPYHALEISELTQANEILKDDSIAKAIAVAVGYLDRYFEHCHYSSRNTDRGASVVLFKTPLWMAKAYLEHGNLLVALEHYRNAMDLFGIPDEPYCFSIALEMRLGGRRFYYPLMKSVFMRYNASCFEVGSELLRKCQGTEC